MISHELEVMKSKARIHGLCFFMVSYVIYELCYIMVKNSEGRGLFLPRYICIHGHFYQPPRENPWLETVELQDSASPWHDWNSRISAECYSRNAASRILDKNGDIEKICNNYSKMSFNIGPTLLSWLEENDPFCYNAILEADELGRKKFSGHGTALAQVYNHIIMPLANRRDKETQVKWGIADFESRFKRKPEGMWLAECAVDTETLEVLAENGIAFTILSPWQAQSVRHSGSQNWQDVTGAKIDTSVAYKCKLPSGRSINLFFYDGVLSQKIAFAGLLNDGKTFADSLIDAYPDNGGPVLSNVATDGESYGHHHKYGDMALAYCLNYLENTSKAQLTVYGEYLEFYPPESEVKLIEPSSWSCAHGVERWRSNCGCTAGNGGFQQEWRKGLRESLDFLRDKLADLYRKSAANIFRNPWDARNEYIRIILDRSGDNINAWLRENCSRDLDQDERTKVLELMEMQRNALLMFTSCGWFFDEISRIEPVQIMRYAARAIELAKKLFNLDLEPDFLKILSQAPSNIPELQNGAKIYELLAKQGRVDMSQMAAYYGITSLVKGFRHEFSEGCWLMSGNVLKLTDEIEDSKLFSAGVVKIRSKITLEEKNFMFAANYLNGMSMLCGVLECSENDSVNQELARELRELFSDTRKLVNKFGYKLYSVRHIPIDSRRKLINELLKQDVETIETRTKDIVENYGSMLEYLTLVGVKPPEIISMAARFMLTSNITRKLREPEPDVKSIAKDLRLAAFWQVKLDEEQIRYAFSDFGMKNVMVRLCLCGAKKDLLDDANELLNLFNENFKWHLELYEAQNLYNEFIKKNNFRNLPHDVRKSAYSLGRALYFSEELLNNYVRI